MVRNRWLSWGLCSALTYTACGGSDDGGLFGFASDGSEPKAGTASSIDPSLGETGGRRATTGGRSATSKGGTQSSDTGGTENAGTAMTVPTGGRGSITVGGSSATGGRPGSSGGTQSGVGGDPEAGGESPVGGVDAGGTPGETGGSAGEPSSTGGTTGGTNTGGISTGGISTGGISTGGISTGGTSTGGTSTGGANAGGRDGNQPCKEARQLMEAALAEAQRCDPSEGVEACTGAVNNECGCGVPVNDPSSAETRAYEAAAEKVRARCGCAILTCPIYNSYVCVGGVPDGDGPLKGRCEGVPGLPRE